MPLYKARRQHNYDHLINIGFLPFEARAFSKNYSASDFSKLPYLRNMLAWRRLYIANAKHRGLTPSDIKALIKRTYQRRKWLKDGKADPWAMLRDFRKKSIDSGDYIPPKRAGSHHKTVTRDQVEEQGKRRRTSQFARDYDRIRGK